MVLYMICHISFHIYIYIHILHIVYIICYMFIRFMFYILCIYIYIKSIQYVTYNIRFKAPGFGRRV